MSRSCPRAAEQDCRQEHALDTGDVILGRHQPCQKKKKTFLCSHKRRYVPGYLGPHISMWELVFARAGVAGHFLKTLTYLQKSAHILITHLEFPQSKLAHISTLK